MDTHTGNTTVILLVVGALVAGGGLLYASPDTAQDVLPASLLPILPQFETVETSVNCTEAQETKENLDEAFGGYIDMDKVAEDLTGLSCGALCRNEHDGIYAEKTYCAKDMLTCVCRTDTVG